MIDPIAAATDAVAGGQFKGWAKIRGDSGRLLGISFDIDIPGRGRCVVDFIGVAWRDGCATPDHPHALELEVWRSRGEPR